jgi:hypothetical protein
MEASPAMPPAPRQNVGDMIELIEEILLRIRPDEPASLVAAAASCKPWCSLVSSHRFRRLYRDFHKTPPMLGFFHNCRLLELFCNTDYRATEESFLIPPSTKGFLPRDPKGGYGVSDCRHGRVLLNLEETFQRKSWPIHDLAIVAVRSGDVACCLPFVFPIA